MQARLEGRRQRQERLQATLDANPFLTDDELAKLFDVSVQTIRLDRLALGIPELRERMRAMASQTHGLIKTIGLQEIVGDIVELELDRYGISVLETTRHMVFEKTRIVRSHFIFAQADSLALALIDADVALTGLVNVKYHRPVMAGERLIAKADVIRRRGENKFVVRVVTRSAGETVFRAKFLIFANTHESAMTAELQKESR